MNIDLFDLFQVADRHLRRELKGEPPWLCYAGPEQWPAYGLPAMPVYVLALDTSAISAHDLSKAQRVLHNISTDLADIADAAKVQWLNTVGLALVIDFREETAEALLNRLSRGCYLIWGGRGSGKTNLHLWAIERRLEAGGEVVVLDPKNRPGKWPAGVRAVGDGADLKAIKKELEKLLAETKARGLKIGSQRFRNLLIAPDEWRILKRDPEIVALVFDLMTLGREMGVDVGMTSPTKSVEGLGIKGDKGLREQYDTIVHVWKMSEEAWAASIERESGEEESIPLPGRHPLSIDETEIAPVFLAPRLLTRDEWKLAKLALKQNGGSFAVATLSEKVKTYFPKLAENGGPLTTHKIRGLTEDWERKGWLSPMVQAVPPVPRKATPELLTLVRYADQAYLPRAA